MNVRRVDSKSEPPERKQQVDLGQENKFKKLTKIEKVGEIDEDKKKKKRQFGQEEEEDLPIKKKLPSPMEALNPKSVEKDIFGRRTPTTDGFGSPQPSLVPPPDFFDGEDQNQDHLPSSDRFWENAPTSSPDPQQSTSSADGSHKKKKASENEPKKEEKEKLSAKEKKLLQAEEKKGSTKGQLNTAKKGKEPSKKKASKKTVSTTALPSKNEKTKPLTLKEKEELAQKKQKTVSPASGTKKTAGTPPKKSVTLPKKPEKKTSHKEPKHTHLKHLADNFAPILILSQNKATHSPNKEKKKEEETAISNDTIKMTPQAAAKGEAATTHLPSYTSPQVQNLFAQMVGTVVIMQQRDVTRTEVMLNSPAFQQSVFKGATITVERYATAPDSFNIRLTGSTQAVNLFQENLSNLEGAFQRGRFNFKIGRLEASHERPLFHRKKGSGEKDADAGGF